MVIGNEEYGKNTLSRSRTNGQLYRYTNGNAGSGADVSESEPGPELHYHALRFHAEGVNCRTEGLFYC
jgi:hypothetical protein